MITPISLMLSLLLAAQPDPADHDQAAELEANAEATELAAKEEEEAGEDDKIICRRTAIIGSKFKKRICGTKKQWETLESRATDTTRDWQRRGKGLEPTDTNTPGT